MTYKELYEKAIWLLEHNEINGKEYDKMIEPLNAEVGNAEPVRHGRWTEHKDYQGIAWLCSECGHFTTMRTYHYCPNCGAKMDGERKE